MLLLLKSFSSPLLLNACSMKTCSVSLTINLYGLDLNM